jgi:hypothetical protein
MNISFIGLDNKKVFFVDFKMHSITEVSDNCCEVAFFDGSPQGPSGLRYFKVKKGHQEMVNIYLRLAREREELEEFEYSLEIM